MSRWTPFEWPRGWKDPAPLALLKSAAVNCVLIDPGDEWSAIRTAAQGQGFDVHHREDLPAAVKIVKGDWPGIRMSRSGDDSAEAGPTGVPWVNTNGWRVAIESALHKPSSIWIDAKPRDNAVLTPSACRMAVADAAAFGGRWIISLNQALAAGIASGNEGALETWRATASAAALFARHANDWSACSPRGVAGVVSDFSGRNSAVTLETVNLIGRAGSNYRVLPKHEALHLDGLRAVVYADVEPPGPNVRKSILDFVHSGGLLITVPEWGDSGVSARVHRMNRTGYRSIAFGKGKIETAEKRPEDPFEFANDIVILISHRYDLVRLWNAGAFGSYCTISEDRKRVLAHLVLYSGQPVSEGTVWVAGQYKSAKLYTIENSEPKTVEFHTAAGGAEIKLPVIRQFAAVELETM